MKTIFASITFKKILKELTEIQLWGPIVFKKKYSDVLVSLKSE